MNRKIILIGDSNVGKTSIISRFFDDNFIENSSPTICSSLMSNKMVNLKGESIILNVWDTAGQERFKAVTDLFFKESQIAFVCFDYLEESTKYSLESWVDSVKMQSPKCILYLVATKTDLLSEDEKDDLESFMLSKKEDNFDLIFMTSAKTNEGITDLFEAAANQELPTIVVSTGQKDISKAENAEKGKEKEKKSFC